MIKRLNTSRITKEPSLCYHGPGDIWQGLWEPLCLEVSGEKLEARGEKLEVRDLLSASGILLPLTSHLSPLILHLSPLTSQNQREARSYPPHPPGRLLPLGSPRETFPSP